MSEEEIITNNKPEEFDIKSIKTFEEMKEELGDKYEKYMYDCNIEFLKSFYEKDLQLYDLQSQLDIANNKLKEGRKYLNETITDLNNFYAKDDVNEALQIELKKVLSIIGE